MHGPFASLKMTAPDYATKLRDTISRNSVFKSEQPALTMFHNDSAAVVRETP